MRIFERKHEKLAPVSVFVKRVFASLGIAFCLIGLALTIGILGYHSLGELGWIDSLLEASMILGGMGPVNEIHTIAGKIFASIYALYSGLIVLVVAGVLFAPIFHRFLHRFHLEQEDDAASRDDGKS